MKSRSGIWTVVSLLPLKSPSGLSSVGWGAGVLMRCPDIQVAVANPGKTQLGRTLPPPGSLRCLRCKAAFSVEGCRVGEQNGRRVGPPWHHFLRVSVRKFRKVRDLLEQLCPQSRALYSNGDIHFCATAHLGCTLCDWGAEFQMPFKQN